MGGRDGGGVVGKGSRSRSAGVAWASRSARSPCHASGPLAPGRTIAAFGQARTVVSGFRSDGGASGCRCCVPCHCSSVYSLITYHLPTFEVRPRAPSVRVRCGARRSPLGLSTAGRVGLMGAFAIRGLYCSGSPATLRPHRRSSCGTLHPALWPDDSWRLRCRVWLVADFNTHHCAVVEA